MVKTSYIEEILDIPKGVTVKVDGLNQITVKGPKGGPITKDFAHASGIKISLEGKKLKFSAHFPKNKTLALVKTLASIINNLIVGVQTNYTYVLKVCYSHFPCNVETKGDENHVFIFLGERAPRKTKYDNQTVKVKVDKDDVYLIGADKEKLGQTAANVKKCVRIRKKDPRVFMDGVYCYKIKTGDVINWEIK